MFDGFTLPAIGGIRFLVKDAQQQRRTPRDVKGPWVRPKVPPKRHGRRGTRRAWKRKHPPHRVWLYREPTDILMLDGIAMIVTPAQLRAIETRLAKEAEARSTTCPACKGKGRVYYVKRPPLTTLSFRPGADMPETAIATPELRECDRCGGSGRVS